MPRPEKRKNRPVWHPAYWTSWVLVFTLYLLSLLPMRTKQNFGAWLGRVLERKLKSRRKVAHRNLSACFPEMYEASRSQLVQDNFVACTRGVMEAFMPGGGTCPAIVKMPG